MCRSQCHKCPPGALTCVAAPAADVDGVDVRHGGGEELCVSDGGWRHADVKGYVDLGEHERTVNS